LLPNYQNLRSRCTQWFRRDVTADSGINIKLIKLHSTHSWIKSVLSSLVSYFVVYFQRKIFNTTKLLNHVASSIELILKRWTIWDW